MKLHIKDKSLGLAGISHNKILQKAIRAIWGLYILINHIMKVLGVKAYPMVQESTSLQTVQSLVEILKTESYLEKELYNLQMVLLSMGHSQTKTWFKVVLLTQTARSMKVPGKTDNSLVKVQWQQRTARFLRATGEKVLLMEQSYIKPALLSMDIGKMANSRA